MRFHPGRASLVLARALWTHAQDLGLSQAKLPNGPVNHMQRHQEAYAALCQFTLRDCRVSRPERQRAGRRRGGGCPTDWLGIRGLGWDEMG